MIKLTVMLTVVLLTLGLTTAGSAADAEMRKKLLRIT